METAPIPMDPTPMAPIPKDLIPMVPMASVGTQTDETTQGPSRVTSASADAVEATGAVETPSGGAVGAIEAVGAIGFSGEAIGAIGFSGEAIGAIIGSSGEPRATWADWVSKSGYVGERWAAISSDEDAAKVHTSLDSRTE